MRVLIIHTKYKEKGGEDSVVDNELQLLQQNGHKIKALFFDNSRHSLLNLLLMPFNIISYVKVTKTISRFKPDVVHLHNLHFTASPSVIRAVKRKQVPMVKTLHNYRLLCPSGTLFLKDEMYLNSLSASFPWKAVWKKVYRNSALLTFWLAFTMWLHKKLGTFTMVNKYITLTEKSRSIFLSSDLKLKKDQVLIKPNFINSDPLPFIKTRDNGFLYVGRLSPEKGIEVLLKAFAVNGLPLTIIGDGPMRDEVTQAQQHNPQITWLGYQNKEVIEEELQKCTALIVPSICLEGMPLSIIEAFAAATPVIASQLGAMESMVSHNYNGLLFAPNNAESLNQHLYKWQTFTANKKEQLSKQALHTYENNYTPEKNIVTLLSVYSSAMNKANDKKSYNRKLAVH